MRTRLAFDIALIVSLLYLPWWAGALVLLSACFLIPKFYEAVIYGIFVDALYGTSYGWHGFHFMATVYTVIVLIVASLIRKRLAW